MIALILIGERTHESAVAYWDDSTRSAWITDPTTPKALPTLEQFGEKRHCVADLRPMRQPDMQPLDHPEAFAVALREYALAHALRPTWFANSVVLIRSDQALTVSLAKVDYGFGVKRLAPPVRQAVDFLMEFFAGIPQTPQDRLIYPRLPDFGIPF